jgi:hypothetical protein
MKNYLFVLAALFCLWLTAAPLAQAAGKHPGDADDKMPTCDANDKNHSGDEDNKRPTGKCHARRYHGEDADLSIEITFLEPFGTSTADASGTTYSIPQFGWNFTDPNQIYPPQCWGTYPLYLVGMPMNFNVTVTRKAEKHADKPIDVKVRALSNILNMDGSAGTLLATQEYIVEDLTSGESRTLNFSVALDSPDIFKGLDVTNVQILRIKEKEGKPNAGLIMQQSVYWCPPPMDQLPDDALESLDGNDVQP